MALDIQNIRAQFPILKQEVNGRPLVYFDNGATSQKPQMVIDAITQYYSKENSNIHRGVHFLSQDAIMLDPQRAEYEFHEYVVGQMTSSVSLIENQEEASITPNPFSDRLNIQLENGNLHRDILIQVYSVRGDLLISDMVKFVNQQYSLQLTELNTGIYILYVDGYRPYKIVKD